VRVHPFIEAEKAAGHGVQRACRLLEVSRAAYYQRRNGVPSPRAAADAAITARITGIHKEPDGTYGSPRVHQALRRQDVSCGKRRVARLMRAAGIEGRRKKRWRTTTIPDPAAERARDLIQRDFAPRPGADQRYAGEADSTGRRNTSITEVCDGDEQEADAAGARGCSAAVGGGSGVAAADAVTGSA
jgi:putative transposase